MKTSHKTYIGVFGTIVVVGLVLGIFGFLQGFQKERDGAPSPFVVAFQEELISRALAQGPHPIEGFDAFLLMRAFRGLQESDFDGVETLEGQYTYTGTLTWDRTDTGQITSAERTIAGKGYETLFINLSQRLAISVTSVEDVIALVDAIDTTAVRIVTLYYYDSNKDTDSTGNILCSENGLVTVERTIPITQTPIQDTIRLLLRGELTQEERARGVTTEYPLEGLELEGASLTERVLTLRFSDPNNRTSGGSCRIGILWFQIRETAKQFDGVDEVRFQPEELFQP